MAEMIGLSTLFDRVRASLGVSVGIAGLSRRLRQAAQAKSVDPETLYRVLTQSQVQINAAGKSAA